MAMKDDYGNEDGSRLLAQLEAILDQDLFSGAEIISLLFASQLCFLYIKLRNGTYTTP